MNKLTTIVIGIAFFLFATFTGTSAFAANPTCADIGHEISKGEPGYLSKLDTDADGTICEKVTITVPVNGGTPANGTIPAPTNPNGVRDANGNLIPATGQVDANGNPVHKDSNGNLIQLDEHGNPIKADNLATTGPNGVLIWGGIGLLALAAGAFIVYAKRRTA